MKKSMLLSLVLVFTFGGTLFAIEKWKKVLLTSLQSKHSQTRRDGLKQVDANTVKGLQALWKVLANRDSLVVDWYVREGAHEALLKAKSDEAIAEITALLAGKGRPLAKEAVIHSIIYAIRKEYVEFYGGEDDDDDSKRREARAELHKSVSDAYYGRVLPVLDKFDPERAKLAWIKQALTDSSSRVRFAAIRGMLFYPSDECVKLLVQHLKDIEKKKKKIYAEWLMNIFALETLSLKSYGECVEDWVQWDEVRNTPVEARVKEKSESEEGEGNGKSTEVVEGGNGVKVTLNFKVAGQGYPLLVLPWQGKDPEYFRPYFHGIEQFCEVYYVQMPDIKDFEGLKQYANSGMVFYPTKELATALNTLMKNSDLDQFGVFAHGPAACTLGMMLTAARPDLVSHLVLLNPMSAGNKYRQALDNVKREGQQRNCQEIINGVEYYLIDQQGNRNYQPADEAERKGLDRALDNLRFADATSPEISVMEALYDHPDDPDVMNDNTWAVHLIFKKKPQIPVVIMMGTRSPWTLESDMKAVASAVGRARVVKFPNCAECPFFFETYKFTQHFSKLFKNAKLKKKEERKKNR